jgi:hypothetical protein
MHADFTAARRAYEMGRLCTAMVRGSVGTLLVLAVAVLALGRATLGELATWAVPVLAVLAVAEWRGGLLARGARRGFLAGLLTLLLPLSVLRPCCDASMIASGGCCTMPSICGVTGVAIGLSLALVWPRAKDLRGHVLAGAGVALGLLSVSATRCGGLFAGETLGLMGGLLAGVVAAAAARAVHSSRRVA